MGNLNINIYQKVHVWFNKKTSLLLAKREKSTDYKAVEKFAIEFILDGIIISVALVYFIPFTLINIASLGASAFLVKRIFPFVIQLFNSINLIKVGK